MPRRSGFGVPNRGVGQHRPPYRPGFGNRNRGWDHDRDRWRGRYGGGYAYGYPGWPGYWYPYPYVIDPGFYGGGDTGNYAGDQGDATNNYAPYTDYGAPYQQDPQEPYNDQPPYPQSPYPQQPYQQGPAPSAARPPYPGSTSSTAPAPDEPLTLIFKDGRAAERMRNYMMNATTLTNMDPQHFERISLDEIDIAATVQANRAHGVDFRVPGAVRE